MPAPAHANVLPDQIERSRSNADSISTIAFYDDNATNYARATRTISLNEEIARFSMCLPSGARVLDLGCGGGRDLLALKHAGMFPIGLELSAQLAAIAHRYSGCQVVIGDMRNPPFANASFQGIWAAASLLHLNREDVAPALLQLHRLLAPGGAFFASLKIGLGAERTADGRLFSYFLPEEWSSMLSAAGFRDVQIDLDGADKIEAPTSAWIQSLARTAGQ